MTGHLRPRRTLVLLAAASLALAGCGDGDDAPDPEPTPGEAPEDPDTEAPDDETDDAGDTDGTSDIDDGDEPTDDGEDPDVDDPGAEGDEQGAPPLDDEASTEDRIVEEDGFGLTLTDVRLGAHDGFDRVTFEVEGDGQLGYNVTVDAEAIQHGSGHTIDVAGDGVVTVSLRGMVMPGEGSDDVAPYEFPEDHLPAPAGAGAVTELVDSGWYEGHHLVFVGTTEEVPVRVARYEDPQRLVIDVVHP